MKRLKSYKLMALAMVLLYQLSGNAFAQLRVDKFELLEHDLTANVHGTMRYDQSGEVAALIKIVTPMTGFTFDGGVYGIVGTEQHEGEVWLYARPHSQKITIMHRHFGELRDYVFPISVEGGHTYRMLLNVGGGRFVNITTTGAETADLSIDGVAMGQTPKYNHYLPFGRYVISCIHNRFEATDTLEVTSGEGLLHYSLRLVDQSPHFGDVEVTAPNADIFFQEKRVGADRWITQLKEGRYEIITKKADCEDASTLFTVKAQTRNAIKANSPVPHTGSVRLYVRPRTTTVTFDDNQSFDVAEPRMLPVGAHQFSFTRKGFVPVNRDISVMKDEMITDTIELEAINYLKGKWAFYFGAGYTLSSLSGVTGYLGSVWNNVDLQLSYSLGISSSKDVYVYRHLSEGSELLSGNTYTMNVMAARLGYQVRLIPRIGITPQVGYQQQMLISTVSDGSGKYADGAKASNITLGAKILAVPAHRIYLFVNPEYAVPMSKDETFDRVAKAADFSVGGFSVSIGLLFNIGK